MPRLAPTPNLYRGRFAPSPSGLLHLGSLVCALASYLDARANAGEWLVRMEDIDPPREQPGASGKILRCLEQHGLHWDASVLYQSSQSPRYRERLGKLSEQRLTYRCNCTRARLKSLSGRYDGHCRSLQPAKQDPCAVRLNIDAAIHLIGESPEYGLRLTLEDFVVHRKDGLFAYQLAVVSDDIDQDITHVVRGRDLEPMTPAQQLLFRVFQHSPPEYLHIPLITDKHGNKLSKQNHARAIDNSQASQNLVECCRLLGLLQDDALSSHLAYENAEEILAWATAAWRSHDLPPDNRIAPASYLGTGQ